MKKVIKTENGGNVIIGAKESTANLKKRIDNLVVAQGFGIYVGKSFNDKEMKGLSQRQAVLEKEFYSRRNHKQYLNKNKNK